MNFARCDDVHIVRFMHKAMFHIKIFAYPLLPIFMNSFAEFIFEKEYFKIIVRCVRLITLFSCIRFENKVLRERDTCISVI